MKALLLLSGGIDSPVAAHMMQKVGLDLIAVHFHSYPLTDKNSIEKCEILCKKLNISKMYVIGIADIQSEVVKKCKHALYFVITRRFMYQIAEIIAEKENCEALVSGDNLGQVASQTVKNMVVISDGIKLPIFRPLLTNDKVETIDYANKIDTFEISKGPEICCLLGPKHPATGTTLPVVQGEEKRLDKELLIKKALESTETKIL